MVVAFWRLSSNLTKRELSLYLNCDVVLFKAAAGNSADLSMLPKVQEKFKCTKWAHTLNYAGMGYCGPAGRAGVYEPRDWLFKSWFLLDKILNPETLAHEVQLLPKGINKVSFLIPVSPKHVTTQSLITSHRADSTSPCSVSVCARSRVCQSEFKWLSSRHLCPSHVPFNPRVKERVALTSSPLESHWLSISSVCVLPDQSCTGWKWSAASLSILCTRAASWTVHHWANTNNI